MGKRRKFYTGAVFLMLGKMRQGNFFLEEISTLNLFPVGWGANPSNVVCKENKGKENIARI